MGGQQGFVPDWRAAEEMAMQHLQWLGFSDARITRSGPDGGVDVVSHDVVAQVKHYSAAVGAPAVRQLRGAAHGKEFAVFYSRAGYTKAAQEFADQAGVALFAYDDAGSVYPVSRAARDISTRRRSSNTVDPVDYAAGVFSEAKRSFTETLQATQNKYTGNAWALRGAWVAGCIQEVSRLTSDVDIYRTARREIIKKTELLSNATRRLDTYVLQIPDGPSVEDHYLNPEASYPTGLREDFEQVMGTYWGKFIALRREDPSANRLAAWEAHDASFAHFLDPLRTATRGQLKPEELAELIDELRFANDQIARAHCGEPTIQRWLVGYTDPRPKWLPRPKSWTPTATSEARLARTPPPVVEAPAVRPSPVAAFQGFPVPVTQRKHSKWKVAILLVLLFVMLVGWFS